MMTLHFQIDPILITCSYTVLRIIELKLFPVPVGFRSGSDKFKVCRNSIIFCGNI